MTTTLRARNSGVAIAYEILGAGPPLLLAQGLGYGGRGWGPALDLLADDFLVVAFDNRGFGGSEVPPGPYTVRKLAEDAVAVLDAAGLERAHVVGASLGGMVAQEVALGWPERVERLVLTSTTPGGPGSHPMPARTVALMADAPRRPPDEALRLFVENALAPDAPPELVEQILEYRRANPPDLAGWQALAAAGATFDALDRIGAVDVPTLVIHGTADAVVDPRNAELLAERIPGARLELWEGRGHLLSWEQPQRFAAVIGEFVS